MIIDGVRCDHELELISCVGRTITGVLIELRMCAQCRILYYVRRLPSHDSKFVVCNAKIYPPNSGKWDDIVKRFLRINHTGNFPS